MKCEEPPSDTDNILGINISTGNSVSYSMVKQGGGRRRRKNRFAAQILENHCNTRGLDFANKELLTEHFKSIHKTKTNNLHTSVPPQFQDKALTSIKVKSYKASDRIIRRKKTAIVRTIICLLLIVIFVDLRLVLTRG